MSNSSATDELTSFAAALSGQYEVEREIGRGGMGVVYLARDLRLDRHVAIKTLPPQLAGDAAVRERFLREARTAARLSHANIVPIHRADEIAGQVFFVMGFIDGDSLAGKLGAGPLSPRDAVPILRDVCAALGYAHRHGVVHRDVKTENILLDSATGRAMVTDFGIARVTEAGPLTATGQVLGTVYYLSPEQVSGERVDARSDIYALGVVAYSVLTGKFPFDGPLASAVLVAHVTKQPLPVAVAAPNIPASLASIVDRCLAKDPAHRFQSCADLDAALAGAQADAERVAVAAPKPKTPLLSDSEAHAVFKRAAELQDMTGVQPRPAPIPMARDAERDASRTSGFKTTNLREAAREAGIGAEYMQHALVERGLARPSQEPGTDARRPSVPVKDLGAKPTFLFGEPYELAYEAVVDGEVSEQDFDLLVDIIRRGAGAWGDAGQVGTVGRSLNWSSQTKTGRRLHATIFPRNGRTTIRVIESLKETYGGIYGGILGGGGGGFGGMMFGMIQAAKPWINHEANIFVGLAVWLGVVAPTALMTARFFADRASRKRQDSLKRMVEDLAEQARDSIRSNK